MPHRLPSAGFFAAVVLAALALIGGGMRLFMELQDDTNHLVVPSVIFAVGAALLINRVHHSRHETKDLPDLAQWPDRSVRRCHSARATARAARSRSLTLASELKPAH